jgi:hypothetical protein
MAGGQQNGGSGQNLSQQRLIHNLTRQAKIVLKLKTKLGQFGS